MFYIVYRTINLVSGKFYIGVHQSLNEKFDGYYGSGLILKQAIKKYGAENFIRNDLFIFDNSSDAFIEEKRLLAQWLDHPKCYNIAKGGCGGFTNYPEERNQKISKSLLGLKRTPETCEKIRKSKLGVFSKEKNPRAIAWAITSPKGITRRIYGTLQEFCKKNHLIFSCLYNNQGIPVPPVKDGEFGGFREKYKGHRAARDNTTGWKLQRIM